MDLGNHKRPRIFRELNSCDVSNNVKIKSCRLSNDPLSVPKLLERLAEGKYGSVTKEYESLHAQVSTFLWSLRHSIPGSDSHGVPLCLAETDTGVAFSSVDGQADITSANLEASSHKSEHPGDAVTESPKGNYTNNDAVVLIDSDEDDRGHQLFGDTFSSEQQQPLAIQVCHPDSQNGVYDQPGVSIQYEKVKLVPAVGSCPFSDLVKSDKATPLLSPPLVVTSSKTKGKGQRRAKVGENLAEIRTSKVNDSGSGPRNLDSVQTIPDNKNGAPERFDFVGNLQPLSPDMESPLKSDSEASENDVLSDLWRDRSLAMESSKTSAPVKLESEDEDKCDHILFTKDDVGIVCRVCGIIEKSIEKILDYQFGKVPRYTRAYSHESRNYKDLEGAFPLSSGLKSDVLAAADIVIHPRHEKQMKSHQLEGFQFLVRNLVTENPGGCILAHAPGSGKTFMLISFIQSFLAKYPSARPLIVLPKGIISTWKSEFDKWQVEVIPLYDFYSVKADKRCQQLEVLHSWEENRSILFLGYKQFSSIVCDVDKGNFTDANKGKLTDACRERLLKVPSLLIIDEGHTPRNEDTDMVEALSRVQTPRKVVLSGTLFQNHVKEVFSILNIVRPKFMKIDSSRAVHNRIMSIVDKSKGRRLKSDAFYDLVEDTLQCDTNLKRKIKIIQELRELTKDVLHYYKGDFLDELPGLVDFTVLLNLSAEQKQIIKKMGKMEKFRKSAACRAIYMHPYLHEKPETASGDKGSDLSEEMMDRIIKKMDIRDGVKVKFFLNVLSLSESVGEKVLVFSQYLIPLKFLERLVAERNNWRIGKEIFMISGDSSSDEREVAMEQFNISQDAKIFFGSIKACGEGISLVGASRVIILDVHLNPSVSRQAIGRAFRPGQTKKVYVYRLVAAESDEEEDHNTSLRKELISKMWFEWSEYSNEKFEIEAVDLQNSGDRFFESDSLVEDVKCLYRR